MSTDRTEQQSTAQIQSARDLSLKPREAPARVPGYNIESLLGSGAYGEVWLALDQKTGRRVAIKFYTRQTSLDFSLLSREVEKLVFLSADRYVVQLLDVGWDAKPPYYVMDFIENGSLEDDLKRRHTLPVEEAVELTEEICIGLMHLHGKGILHCDLKPGNVLLDQDKKPRLADFGQSRLSHEQAPALGTLFFMAPEQADLQAAPDARWDVYALGALLYCMLTGEPPFRDGAMLQKIEKSDVMEDRLDQYRRLINAAPRPLAHRRVPGVDRSLAEIIERCIDRDPKQRFASVQSVFQALRQREHAHARRPLMVLGLLGPLMLLAVMSVFGWNAWRGAILQTDQAIKTQTVETSQWIAELAARSASEQIDSYFRVLNELVEDRSFRREFAEVIAGDSAARPLIDQLADPADNDNPLLDPVRQQLIAIPARQDLEVRYLQQFLEDPSCPPAASWFVCDYTGTQIASVFDTGQFSNTQGKNYSYRSYFTGRPEDARSGPPDDPRFDVDPQADRREHIHNQVMSAIFLSEATNTWKIAFAAPVYLDDRFLGIAAVTANILGSFVEFENSDNQYVMLVDTRPGPHQGTVLEHPLLSGLINGEAGRPDLQGNKLPASLTTVRIDEMVLDRIARGDPALSPFEDPMARDPLGSKYNRDCLASWAAVRRRSPAGRQETGFKVIAVADQQNALQPSRRLGQQLARMGSMAILFFLIVSGGLLYFVFQSLRRSREKVARVLDMAAAQTVRGQGIEEMATLMAGANDTPSGGER
jgi:serine/threonine protein kinase